VEFVAAVPIEAKAPPPTGAPRSRAAWLILILVLALAAAGWWFLTAHRMTEPGNAVRPPAANPAQIKLDSDAPAIDTPLRPSPAPGVPVQPPVVSPPGKPQ
jgi:hypothetical protein